jgi:crotonobetainyl-CoA:carnitine CoA-transferase CaiB-like acyl-CoA transferase
LFQGLGGLMSVTGERDDRPGGGPQKVGIPIVDLFTGMYATVSILAALHHRDSTGAGQHIDVSLFDTVLAMSSGALSNYFISGKVPGRIGTSSANITPYDVFPCADGQMVVASANQSQFTSLARAIGKRELAVDPRFTDNGARMTNHAELFALLSEVFRSKPRMEWEEILSRAGVPCGPINDYRQALAHPRRRTTARRSNSSTRTACACPVWRTRCGFPKRRSNTAAHHPCSASTRAKCSASCSGSGRASWIGWRRKK